MPTRRTTQGETYYSGSRVLRTHSPAAEPQVLRRFLRTPTAEPEVLSDHTGTYYVVLVHVLIVGCQGWATDGGAIRKSKHNLQLAEHGHQEVPSAWVLLEKA